MARLNIDLRSIHLLPSISTRREQRVVFFRDALRPPVPKRQGVAIPSIGEDGRIRKAANVLKVPYMSERREVNNW